MASPVWYFLNGVPVISTLRASVTLAGDGSATAPSYSFASATTTGFYFGSSQLNVSISGTNRYQFNAASFYAPALTFDFANADVVATREAAGHWFQRNSTNANRWSLANTYTSATNYEAFSVDWQSVANIAITGTRTAATGTARVLRLVAQDSSAANDYSMVQLTKTSAPFFRQGLLTAAAAAVSTTATGNMGVLGELTNTATSGSVVNTAITPTYNQAAATTANTDLLINRTETAVGSGLQKFIEAQVGGTPRFSLFTTGVASFYPQTATPAGGSTSARIVFGSTAGFGVYIGSGAPSVSAAQGSLYLRSDGSSTSTRAYINTDGGTTWTNITTAA